VGILPSEGAAVLLGPAPNENLGAALESAGAAAVVSELLPNENPGVGALAVVAVGADEPKEKDGTSCLLSLFFSDELPKLKPPPLSPPIFFRFWAGSVVETSAAPRFGTEFVSVLAPNLNLGAGVELDDEDEAAKLPNNPLADGAEAVGASPVLDEEEEAGAALEEPKLNFGFEDAGAESVVFDVLGFSELPNLKPPDGAELLEADAVGDFDLAAPPN